MCNHSEVSKPSGCACKDGDMRKVRRPRRYVAHQWLVVLRPILRYSHTRDAFVLRGVGASVGPVLRVDRRSRQGRTADGVERRRASIA